MSKRVFQNQLLNGKSVSVGGLTVTPQSRVLSVRLPFGGFVWNRPVVALVEGDGRSQRIPIVDKTSVFVLMMAGVATAVTILSWRRK